MLERCLYGKTLKARSKNSRLITLVIFLLAGAALLGALAGGAIGGAATGTATGLWVGVGVGALAGVGIAGTAYALSRPPAYYYPTPYPYAYNSYPTAYPTAPVYYSPPPPPRGYYYPAYY